MPTSPVSVWIVDDDASVRRVLSVALTQAGFDVQEFDVAAPVFAALASAPRPDVLVTDLRMPGNSGLDVLRHCAEHAPGMPVIVMTAYADLDNSVAALRAGAFELLPKPFDVAEVVELIRRATTDPPPSAGAPASAPSLIGSAPAMKEVFRIIGRLAGTELNVLLTGESGTGKERVARALHDTSPRAAGPFVAINVAAIPAELIESELFGHARGAYSGAEGERAGVFEQAAGGTLLLDEIGEMPAGLQTRLLRVLADGDFRRLGEEAPRRADVRLIAATNADLRRAVDQGRFRADLFHRLDVVEIRLPPLRERRDDIPLLLDHYLHVAAAELNSAPRRMSADALAVLVDHAWPGNVRELVNLCFRLTALVPGAVVERADLPFGAAASAAGDDWERALGRWVRNRLAAGAEGLMSDAVERLEQVLIDEALRATGNRRAEAARRLGIGRNTLSRKLD